MLDKHTDVDVAELRRNSGPEFDLTRVAYSARSTLPAILVVRTDGGSDHSPKLMQVQLALLSLYLATGMDMLVAVRTAPGHSFLNDVEKKMALLNLGVANIALARSKMNAEHEAATRSDGSMAKIRKRAQIVGGLKKAWMASTAAPIKVISDRFTRLRCGDHAVQMQDPATDNDILSMHDVIADVFDSNYNQNMTQKKNLRDLPNVSAFINSHCRTSAYMFCIRKCEDEKCIMCVDRRSGKMYENLSPHDPPLPSKANKLDQSYLHFKELSGKPSDESDRPSYDLLAHDQEGVKERKECDKAQQSSKGKSVFRQEKARHYVRCDECQAARLIYSTSAASTYTPLFDSLLLHIEGTDYTCGDDLFENASEELQGVFAVKRHIQSKKLAYCALPTQHAYYTNGRFPPTCAWCEETSEVELLTEQDLQAAVGTRRCDPICRECHSEGKSLPLWGSVKKFAVQASKKMHPKQNHKAAVDEEEFDEEQSEEEQSGGVLDEEELDDAETGVDDSSEESGHTPMKAKDGNVQKKSPNSIMSFFDAKPNRDPQSVECLMRTGCLVLWTFPHNDQCERCSEGGALVKCSFCNLVWHLDCLKKDGKGRRSETEAGLANAEALWACGACFDEALRKRNRRSTKGKITPNPHLQKI